MSSLCSEPGRAYSGTTLLHISVDQVLHRHVNPWNRMCCIRFKEWNIHVCDVIGLRLTLGGVFKTAALA